MGRGAWGAAPLASDAVGKFLKYRFLSASLRLPVVSKSIIHAYFADNRSTLIVIHISQHRKYRKFILI